jgi:predicted Holliday junction resolvase-like endonuclease
MVHFTNVIIAGLIVLVFLFIALYVTERKELQRIREALETLRKKFHGTTIKHGKNWEQFAPFMAQFPGDREHSVFIGNPIDYISFGDDRIMFIEVKTGSSRLSPKQKRIKELVEQKKVEWKEMNEL